MRKLYYSYIYPYLIYCIEVCGISPHTHLKPLLLLQKKIVRIMTFSSYYAHTAPIFKDLTILTIYKLIVHRLRTTMYKYSNGLLPDVFNTLYIKIAKFILIVLEVKICIIFYLEHKHSQTSVLKFEIH